MKFHIALVNGKGGVGKTMVSLLLAMTLRNAGYPVTVIDTDPQKSASTFAAGMGLDVACDMSGDYSLGIIDTPPNIDHPDTRRAIRTADLLILVTTPSPSDLGATAATAQLIQRERALPTVVLFNRVQASNRFAAELPNISARLPFPTLPCLLNQRTAYQVAELQGWSSMPAFVRVELGQMALAIAKLVHEPTTANAPQ